MHEVGLLSSMLKTIEQIMEEQELTAVTKIVLDVGELSGAIPHYMEECWPAARYKTRFEDTELVVNVIPGDVKCNRCGKVFNGYHYDCVCPGCGNRTDFEPLSGRDLMIKEIEGY